MLILKDIQTFVNKILNSLRSTETNTKPNQTAQTSPKKTTWMFKSLEMGTASEHRSMQSWFLELCFCQQCFLLCCLSPPFSVVRKNFSIEGKVIATSDEMMWQVTYAVGWPVAHVQSSNPEPNFHWWLDKTSGLLKPHLEDSHDTSGLSAKLATPFIRWTYYKIGSFF